jgi:hypothetical protein
MGGAAVDQPGWAARLGWLGYAAPALAVWGLWWAALWPGLWSADPLHEWHVARVGPLNDWHPFPHALLLAAITRAGGAGMLPLLHLVSLALLLGAALAALRRLGTPRPIAVLAAVGTALLPVYALNAVAAWKDTTAAAVLLAAVVVLLHGAAAGRLGAVRAALLGLAAAATWLFRHPGPAVALALLAGALAAFPDERRAVALAAAVCLAIAGLVRAPVKAALRVPPTPAMLQYHSLLHDIAGELAAGAPISERDRAALDRVLPIARWRALYDPETSNPLLFGSGIDARALEDERLEIVPIWLRLARARPGVILRHRLAVSAFAWNPLAVTHVGPVGPGGQSIGANEDGIAFHPMVARLGGAIARWKWSTEVSPWRIALWSPATFLWTFLAACAVGWTRTRSRLFLALLAPALANTAIFVLLSSSPEGRFQLPVTVLVPVAVALAFADPALAVRNRLQATGFRLQAAAGQRAIAVPADGAELTRSNETPSHLLKPET